MEEREIIIPTKEDLLKTFKIIKESFFDGVPGVLKFDSGEPGPTLGISIQTHGNEISGLATLWYFLNIEPIEKLIQKGAIFFVVNNINATEKYFSAKTAEERRRARFIDTNFNRLPKDVMSQSGTTNYEFARAQELKKIWEKFEIGLDIHSTTQDSEPMIIAINKFEKELVKGFPIDIVISNIENIQIGRPTSFFYGGDRAIPVMVIESGSHENKKSFETAIICTLSLMNNLGLVFSPATIEKEMDYLLYEVVDSLIFQNSSYLLSHVFPMFGDVLAGEIMAQGDSGPIYAPITGCTIFGPKQEKPDIISEEILFFTKPPQKLLF